MGGFIYNLTWPIDIKYQSSSVLRLHLSNFGAEPWEGNKDGKCTSLSRTADALKLAVITRLVYNLHDGMAQDLRRSLKHLRRIELVTVDGGGTLHLEERRCRVI